MLENGLARGVDVKVRSVDRSQGWLGRDRRVVLDVLFVPIMISFIFKPRGVQISLHVPSSAVSSYHSS